MVGLAEEQSDPDEIDGMRERERERERASEQATCEYEMRAMRQNAETMIPLTEFPFDLTAGGSSCLNIFCLA